MSKRSALAIVAAILLPVLGFIVLARVSASKRTRLRITNVSRYPAQALIVLFPESSIAFGTVPPGTTTEYEYVPKGVYRYAAYRFKLHGKDHTQLVTDWVGEKPMPGAAFTYTITVDPDATQGERIEIVKVARDE